MQAKPETKIEACTVVSLLKIIGRVHTGSWKVVNAVKYFISYIILS